MTKSDKIILFVIIVLLCISGVILYNLFSKKTNTTNNDEPVQIFSDDFYNNSHVFTDGLKNPDSTMTYKLDEDGTGLATKTVYYIDINNDNVPDRITKSFMETGTAHSYYKYDVELKHGNKFINITPKSLQTTNGESCDLQQIQFVFIPTFEIIVVYREMGDTWNQPMMAYKQTYTLSKDNKLVVSKPTKMKQVCDVKKLF